MKKALKILVIAAIALNLSGCWSRRELNTLGIVLGVAIDASDQPDEIEMTAQLVNAADMENSASAPYINISATGSDVMTIFRGFTHEISRKLYIPHNQVLIFGEEKARAGVHDSLDFFLRNHESRLTLQILVAKGKAEDVLDYEPHFLDLPAADIQQCIEIQGATSQTAQLTLFEFMQCLTSPVCSSLAPIIEVVDNKGEKNVKISGAAVFKEDKMVGEMDTNQIRGVLWVTNKVESGILRVKVKEQNIDLDIMKASSEMEPVLGEDGSIRMKIKINNWDSIVSLTGSEDISKEENLKLLKEAAKESIIAEIQDAFKKSKELKCDVFGFGNRIKQADPKAWENYESHWDEVYPQIKLDIEIETNITGLGRLAKPNYPEKETSSGKAD